MSTIYIYKIYSKSHNKHYIGQTVNVESRMEQHHMQLPNCSSRLIFEMSADVHDVQFDILAETYSPKQADDLEKMFILNGRDKNCCVNIQLPLGSDETLKDRQKTNCKRWVDNNRQKWNEYMNKRNKEKRDELELLRKEREDNAKVINTLIEQNISLLKIVDIINAETR